MPARRRARVGGRARHRGDDRDQRDDRQVLEQQDREGALAVRRVEPPVERSIGSTCAVEDSASGRPSASARRQAEAQREVDRAALSASPHSTTCSRPSPKMSCRSRHSRLGLSSSPTRNSSRAMPISATLGMLARLADQAEHMRPDERAGDEIAQGRAEPEPAEQDDEDQRRAEHDRAVVEQRGGGLRRLRAASVIARVLDRREQRPERQQDRAVARRVATAPAQARQGRPVAGIVALAGEPGGQARPAPSATSSPVAPDACCADQRRGGLAEGAGLRPPATRRRPGRPRRAGPRSGPCCRRSASAARALPSTARAAPDAGATPPAAGSRWCRAARSCPAAMSCPRGPSSSTMPSAFSSSRMRSASAKSRRALASARAAIRASMSARVATRPGTIRRSTQSSEQAQQHRRQLAP